MHLGMSGSFRVLRDGDAETRPASFHHERSQPRRTTTWCSTCRRARRHLQRSAPLRLHEARPRARARRRIRCCARSAPSRSATSSSGDAGARLRRQEDQPQGRAARPAGRRRPRQHLCLRGAEPRAAVAAGGRRRPSRRAQRRAERARRARWSTRSRRCSTTRSRPAARRCATTARPTASSAISSTISASTTAKASRARRRGCTRHDQAHRADRPLDVLLSGVPETEPREESAMSYQKHHRRNPRPRRHHPLQPAAGAQRAQRRAGRTS